MKCLCIGICQIVSICEILKKSKVFTSVYNEILCYTIFTITPEEMKNLLENVVPTCDLILSQPVSENYRGTDVFSTKVLRNRKKESAKHLIIANCYFTGYDPVPFQITDSEGNITSVSGVSYFPSIALNFLLNSDLIHSCMDWCNLDAYSQQELENNYRKTITELKQRESKVFDNDYGVDVPISDFIESNYQNKFLFHTYNHPTNILLLELTKRITDKLGLILENAITLDRELLGDVTIPPPISVYVKMKMTFQYPLFKFGSREYKNTRDAMASFISLLILTDPKNHQQWKSSIIYGRSLLK